jgi:hypothetical protein
MHLGWTLFLYFDCQRFKKEKTKSSFIPSLTGLIIQGYSLYLLQSIVKSTEGKPDQMYAWILPFITSTLAWGIMTYLTSTNKNKKEENGKV